MNVVVLTGRLTDDVELKVTTSGVHVCRFTLAVRRPNVKDTTDFINCIAWRGTAEFISKWFKKGDALEVSKGVLTSRKYKDKDNNNRVAFEVRCDEVSFALTNTKTNDTQTNAPTYAALGDYEELGKDDELPF